MLTRRSFLAAITLAAPCIARAASPDSFRGDDTEAWRQALDAGGVVRASARDYRIDGQLVVRPGNTIEGNGARLLLGPGADVRGFLIRNASDVRVSDLTIEETDRGKRRNGFSIENSSSVTLERCRAVGCGFYGFVTSQDTATNQAAPCNDIHVLSCTAEDCGHFGFELFPKALSRDLEFRGNTALRCGFGQKAGAGIKAGQATLNAEISDCTVSECQYGFAVGTWEELVIRDSTLQDCVRSSFTCSFNRHRLYHAGFRSARLRGNTVLHSPGFTTQHGNDAGLAINASTLVDNGPFVVERNSFRDLKYRGYLIRLGAAIPNIIIRDNDWINCLPGILDGKAGALPAGLEMRANRSR